MKCAVPPGSKGCVLTCLPFQNHHARREVGRMATVKGKEAL